MNLLNAEILRITKPGDSSVSDTAASVLFNDTNLNEGVFIKNMLVDPRRSYETIKSFSIGGSHDEWATAGPSLWSGEATPFPVESNEVDGKHALGWNDEKLHGTSPGNDEIHRRDQQNIGRR
jgi:hypothetical protein